MCSFMIDISIPGRSPFRPGLPVSPQPTHGFTKSSMYGYRLLVVRDGKRVRLISKGGNDYARRLDRRGGAQEPADPIRDRRRGMASRLEYDARPFISKH